MRYLGNPSEINMFIYRPIMCSEIELLRLTGKQIVHLMIKA